MDIFIWVATTASMNLIWTVAQDGLVSVHEQTQQLHLLPSE
jgi:hypothetical protein